MYNSFARYLSIGAVVLGAACSSSTPTSNNQAALTGRVDPASQSPAGQATTVTASFVDASGGLTAVSGPVAVDASGRYTVQLTSLTASATPSTAQVIVTARNPANVELGSAAVEAKFTNSTTFKVAPINASSSAEAKLLIDAKASGQWGTDFTLGEMRALIGDQIAGQLGVDAQATSAAASVSVAAIAGWRSMLNAQSFSAANLKAALDANLQAEAALDAQLDSSTTVDQANAAGDAYLKAFVQSFTNASASVDQLGYAATATADVVAVAAASMSATLQGQVLARASTVQADRVTASVNANLMLAGASAGSMQAATTAGATLKTQIISTTQAGIATKAQLKQAWMQYRTAIDTVAASTISPVLAAPIATDFEAALAANLTTLVSARAVLGGSATVMANADATAISAYITSNSALTTSLTTAGVADVQAKALIATMTEVEAAAGNP